MNNVNPNAVLLIAICTLVGVTFDHGVAGALIGCILVFLASVI